MQITENAKKKLASIIADSENSGIRVYVAGLG